MSAGAGAEKFWRSVHLCRARARVCVCIYSNAHVRVAGLYFENAAAAAACYISAPFSWRKIRQSSIAHCASCAFVARRTTNNTRKGGKQKLEVDGGGVGRTMKASKMICRLVAGALRKAIWGSLAAFVLLRHAANAVSI